MRYTNYFFAFAIIPFLVLLTLSFVSAGNVSNSFATGNVSTTPNSGGLVGKLSTGIVNNSYWYNHSGNPNDCSNDGNENCTAVDDIDEFYDDNNEPLSSWDFENVWKVVSGGFPNFIGNESSSEESSSSSGSSGGGGGSGGGSSVSSYGDVLSTTGNGSEIAINADLVSSSARKNSSNVVIFSMIFAFILAIILVLVLTSIRKFR